MYPILFEWGEVKVFSYTFFMGLGWGLGLRVCLANCWREHNNLKGFWGLAAGVFISSWIGAKILFLAISYPSATATNPNFWLGGGFVFYGGLLTAFAFVLLYCLVLKKFPMADTPIFFPAVAFGHAIGRVGCFLSGCCYGKHGHPVQLYEALFLLALGLFCQFSPKHRIATIYLLGYGVGRFFLEFLRADSIRGVLPWGPSVSQLISLGIIFLGVFVLLRRPRQSS